MLIEKGWNTISWPKEYGGREYSCVEQAIFDERTSYYRAPNLDVIAGGMVAPTILRVGTEEQKKKWIPRIASGEISYVAGLQRTERRVGSGRNPNHGRPGRRRICHQRAEGLEQRGPPDLITPG